MQESNAKSIPKAISIDRVDVLFSGRATGWVQPRSESTLEILEASRLSESPTGRHPVLRTTNFLSKIVLFGQYWYYFVAVRTAERIPA
jgi:hypothetical protein